MNGARSPVVPENLAVAVFCYNRARHMENAVESVLRHLPEAVPVWVFDDGSDLPAAKAALSRLSEHPRVEVFAREVERRRKGSRRGLYANMQWAYDTALQRGVAYLWFLQEDVQVVRPVDRSFFEELEYIFSSRHDVLQVKTAFGGGSSADRLIDDSRRFYLTNPERKKLASFDAVGLVSVERLQAVNWAFEPSEKFNNARAAEHGAVKAWLRDPVEAQTPLAETYRRSPTALHSLFKNTIPNFLKRVLFRVGFHPYNDMSSEAVARLQNRPIEKVPSPSAYLSTVDNLAPPWRHNQVKLTFSNIKKLTPASIRARFAGRSSADAE